jgi:hypothetical protein
VPPDRFLLSWYDDLAADPVAYLGRVCSFLGVDAGLAAGIATRSGLKNPRPRVEIPVGIVREIAKQSRPGLARLADRYGGHATRWLARCDRILEGGPVDA